MSEAIQNSDTPSQCDRLLDYVYGELGGDDLEQFKLHLLTCDKCKRELAGLERVRSAVKQAMPSVEPPVDKMAQLMHAAAQQKPKRGKVLMFVRRTVSHPAYAAAAVFVLVATAVTVNYSRNALEMPKEAVHEPVPAIAAPPAQAGPAAQPPAPEPNAPGAGTTIEAPPAEAPKTALDGLVKDKSKEGGIVLKTEPPGAYTVRKAAPAKKISTGNTDEVVFEPIANGYRSKTAEAKPESDARRDQPAASGNKTRHHASGEVAADDAKQEEVQLARPADVAKPKAPPPPPAPKPVEKRESYSGSVGKGSGAAGGERGRFEMDNNVRQAPAKETSMAAQNQWTAPTGGAAPAAPAAAAPAPATTSTPQATPSLNESKSAKNSVDNNNTRQQKSVDPTLLKKQFLSYAQSNRCTEAVNTFQQLDRQYSGLLTVTDRLEYVKCLRRAGQNSLADLENKAIAEEQQKVNAMRASKKAKPARNAADEKAASPAALEPAMK